MFRIQHIVRGAFATAVVAGALACNSDSKVLFAPVANPIFQSYVALGNSITAGFQSDGINDSTQSRSYAVLLARQMGTRFAYPSLVMPGCRPPVASFTTQARVGGATSTSTTCFLRNPASVTEVLNNVAVPGAGTADIEATVGPAASTLTTLFLGGKTQVQKALQARPTFATVWVGNNDVLQPAITGTPGSATPAATFISNYKKMIETLVTGAPGIKGVLIGVGQTANLPILFAAAALQNPAFVGGLNAATGKTIVVDPTTCTATTTARIGFPIVAAIRAYPAAGGHPPTIACAKTPTPPIGDIFVLDAAEQVEISTLINAYNAYIKAKADTIGFAYYDPNTTLTALNLQGQIPAAPNLASATAPYGTYFSLDGVHPSTVAHVLLANDLITVINAKYGTTLAKVP